MTPEEQLAETIRREGARVLASLIRTLGSLQLAEDAVQDAAVAALQTWPRDGIPGDPRAWLAVTARHKAYDALRREAVRPGKELASAGGVAPVVPDPVPEVLELVEPDSVVRDDQLRLVFTCCHPALAREAQVALALRTLAGVDVAGDPVPLADQDRSRWDHAAIDEASALLAEAVRRSQGVAGSFQLQAHLSACHSTAQAYRDTDWDRIVTLYDLLLRRSANPAVALNRAVAVGERDGPAAGLAALD